MASEARKFIAAVLAEADPKKFLSYGDISPLYQHETAYKPVLDFVSEYVRLTGKLPSPTLVETETQATLGTADADSAFLFEKLKTRHIDKRMKLLANEAKETLPVDPLKAMTDMVQGLRGLQNNLMGSQLTDFKEAAYTLLPTLYEKWSGKIDTVPFGWPTLDKMTGGLNAGDFVSMVGRPGQGKTWLLLYAALSAWQKLNRPVLFVSMEMNRQIILERMAAMFASIPPDFFKDGLSPTMFGENLQDKLEDKLVSLQNSQSAPFIVLDSKLTATVEDIVSLTQMIQPSAVFIDGAYMLSHPHAKSMYDAVAKNAHLLKGELAERCALPTICTWQFSREADKLKKGETPGLNHIGYSDTIGQLSSIVLGLFEEEEGDNVELHKRRHVHILKGRSGEAGDFYTRWDFKNVDFSEIEDAELQVYEL